MDFLKYYHTLKHLKPIQIRYQLWYRIRKKWRKLTSFKYPLSISKIGHPLKLSPAIPRYTSFNNYTFTFLNQSKTFQKNVIHWNYSTYGKLWAYNLNYFDFLLQPDMDLKTGCEIIDDYISKLNNNSIGLEPYPISLRGINWIKFISHFLSSHSPIFSSSQMLKFSSSLYAQYQILLDNLEYHLMGNHLLENGFSLLFGSFYFKDEQFYKKTRKIITEQLEEQILKDGGHFELSPMYHQIILDRLLDCINLLQNNQRFDDQNKLLQLMEEKAQKMIKWLNQMTFSNGKIPLLNDSAPDIAPSTRQINDYASRLNLIRVNPCNSWTNSGIFSDSGYRHYHGNNYECILDIGQIGPTYQPGHAHADTFNFVLTVNDKPIIVDSGISTYNLSTIRLKERGTAAHNTVTVANENSSEVWSSFRVARRANVKVLKDKSNHILASHDGYRRFGTTHEREWIFTENEMEITDKLTGKITEGKAHIWFASSVAPQQKENTIETDKATFIFENAASVNLIPEEISNGYNRYLKTHKLEIGFKDHIKTIIKAQ